MNPWSSSGRTVVGIRCGYPWEMLRIWGAKTCGVDARIKLFMASPSPLCGIARDISAHCRSAT